jgi:hypothetical protein
MLDIWPTLPIAISDLADATSLEEGANNIHAALKHHDRVCRLSLWSVPNSLFERFTVAMVEPFPELISLALRPSGESALVLPDAFLGGSAPRLRCLYFNSIGFPGLTKLLVSLVDLTHLFIWDIPHSSYLSPETIVTCLSTMTRLESLFLGFHSPLSQPDRAGRRPPVAHTVLPHLSQLEYNGVSEYLEDFLARIDTPQLCIIRIRFFNQIIFNISQLPQFTNHADSFKILNCANIVFSRQYVEIRLSSQPETLAVNRTILTMGLKCGVSDWQLSSLAQVCSSSLSHLSTLERLDICEDQYSRPHWQDDIEHAQWIETLHPFIAARSLYVSEELEPHVIPPLAGLFGERIREVLPALQNLFLRNIQPVGRIREALDQCVTARKISGYPVAIH